MVFRFSASALAVLASCMLVIAAPVAAQTKSGSGAPAPKAGQTTKTQKPAKTEQPAKEVPTVKLTDEKLDAFVGAAIKVIQVRQAWKPKIDAAKSKEEAQQLVGAAQLEMKLAVENSPGITMQEYVIIAEGSRENQRLSQEIQKRVSERMQSVQPAPPAK